MTERRTARRYDLSLPVIIRIPVEDTPGNKSGKTRDISTRGVYFTIDERVEAGSELDITLTLPAEITQGTEVFVISNSEPNFTPSTLVKKTSGTTRGFALIFTVF